MCTVNSTGPETLNKAVSSEKWDRIKVVCTQPYNKVKESFK